MQAKPITETAFVLMTDAGERFGLLNRKEDLIELRTADTTNEFSKIEDLEELVGSIHFMKPPSHTEASNIQVGGYPVKHEEVFEIEEADITTYKASPNSRVRWVPGWWGIRFTRGYICFLCPKLATLTENEFVGPFKDKFEAETAVKIRNQALREEE